MRIVSGRTFAAASLFACSILPLAQATATEAPSSNPAASPVSDVRTASLHETSEQTPDVHWEKLRLGLERAAKKYPTPEAHMAQLREGLERLARNLNHGAN